MTTLSIDKPRDFVLGEHNHLPVIAADIIYEGAAVGDNGAGYARPLTAGDPFRGFAQQRADNASGAAGDINVWVRQKGRVVLAIGSLAITDVGKPVYASDDDTFTLTASTNSFIGRVVRWVSTGYGEVEFDASKGNLGAITALTDSTTGTANDTLSDVGGAFSQATLNNNFADIAAKLNAIIAYLK